MYRIVLAEWNVSGYVRGIVALETFDDWQYITHLTSLIYDPPIKIDGICLNDWNMAFFSRL